VSPTASQMVAPENVQRHAGTRINAWVDSDGVARLRLARADVGNAIDMTWVQEFAESVATLAGNSDVRCLLIDADGSAFTVGGDLGHLGQNLHRLADELVDMLTPFHEALAVLATFPAPVVCAVQGAVAGGGLGLLWAADIVIAADDLKLTTAFARLGVSGDGGSSWYLPRLVGLRRALQLTLECPVLDAAAALEYGLVTRVVACEDLVGLADNTARRLAAGPTVALALQRQLVRSAQDRTVEEGLAAELDAMRTCGATVDAVEGMAAFIARRRPEFIGS